MESLPLDLLVDILARVSHADVARAQAVCRYFRVAVHSLVARSTQKYGVSAPVTALWLKQVAFARFNTRVAMSFDTGLLLDSEGHAYSFGLDDRVAVGFDVAYAASDELKQVWAWGSNSKGQLGLADGRDRPLPTRVVALDGKPLTDLSACYTRGVAVSRGKLYVWGASFTEGEPPTLSPTAGLNGEGAASPLQNAAGPWQQNLCGAADSARRGGAELEAAELEAAVEAAERGGSELCQAAARTTLKESGDEGCCGAAQTGVDDETDEHEGLVFVSASMGSYFGVAVDSDGALWWWGDPAPARLQGLKNDLSRMPKGELTSPVVSVSAGWRHALCVDARGGVFAFGRNHKNQVSTSSAAVIHAPVRVPRLPSGATNFSSFAVSASGELYGWGASERGEMAQRAPRFRVLGPERILPGLKVCALGGRYGIVAVVSNSNASAVAASAGTAAAASSSAAASDTRTTDAPKSLESREPLDECFYTWSRSCVYVRGVSADVPGRHSPNLLEAVRVHLG
ncbi:hypothetical protein M885DRAFT_616821 [Pelagophyceae sp. CCMP2097]|nr:hypothetical protein M885DRAFT_616821 [Pelagophyceae sp. CCMP2097]